ncbi:hypothetical protein KKG45_01775 [bacterium]|nr:hypothetical protein [bacterium]MBU1071955.1 hypothetical protein [bacterium]MBU1675230.1 hypothetical protein [bacterium]
MKNRTLTLSALVILGMALAPAVASAQTADLVMTDFTAEWDGETLSLTAEVAVSTHGSFGVIDTEVGFYLDDYFLGALPLLAEQQALGTCHEQMPPNCDGFCEPIYIDGVWLTNGACLAMNWPLSGNLCCCAYVMPPKQYLTPYHGESMATATVDPMGVYAEGDETNNSVSIALGPIAGDARSWSQVKALYR